MFLLDDEKKLAISQCLLHGIPFAAYLNPGDTCCRFLASDPTRHVNGSAIKPDEINGFNGFLFNRFELSDTLHAYGIPQELSAVEAIALADTLPKLNAPVWPPFESTDYDSYRHQVESITKAIGSESEKVVLSHIVCIQSELDPATVADKYFSLHPSCFRYIYYTPESGIWIGASPELLLAVDRISGDVRSMSLAGTRKAGENTPWDRKNTLEHNIVTDFIVKTLSPFCESISEPKQTSVIFGDIEHLCHIIQAKASQLDLSALIPRLCPTPALCGYPCEKAMTLITQNEQFQRNCYGGFVGISAPERASFYVNLRCASTQTRAETRKQVYTLYGGGGLTCHSTPESEWIEAKSKMNSLIKVLSNQSSR